MQNHQADSPLYVWPDVWSADLHLFMKKYGHTWHRMSLLRPDVIKQHKPNQTKPFQVPTLFCPLYTLISAFSFIFMTITKYVLPLFCVLLSSPWYSNLCSNLILSIYSQKGKRVYLSSWNGNHLDLCASEPMPLLPLLLWSLGINI